MSQQINDFIASLDGLQAPGGCDYCDAYQVIQAHVDGEQSVHMIRVLHDDDCPWLAARNAP